MILEKSYAPLYGDLDPDFTVGLRGYLSWFQDAATEYMNIRGLGNDRLPEAYGLCWVFTGYRLRILEKAKRGEGLTLRLWSSEEAPSGWIWEEFSVQSGERVLMAGRLECCLLDLKTGHRCRNAPFPMPTNPGVKLPIALSDLTVSEVSPDAEGFFHVVRFSDLDASLHLNNLSEVSLFLNAFSAAELNQKAPLDFVIRYHAQCFEGETVTLRREDSATESQLSLTRADGTVASRAALRWA